MRELDLRDVTIVQVGTSWPHAQQPTSREMLPFLERNEQFVSWLQPKNGDVDDQLPSIKIGQKFFSLSLRLQKALFRHVRLQSNFVNRERLPDGREKLRIPAMRAQGSSTRRARTRRSGSSAPPASSRQDTKHALSFKNRHRATSGVAATASSGSDASRVVNDDADMVLSKSNKLLKTSTGVPVTAAPINARCTAEDANSDTVVFRPGSSRRLQARGVPASKCECLDLVNAAARVTSSDSNASVPAPLSKLKLYDAETCKQPTSFFMSNDEIVCGLLQQLRSECPALVASRSLFMQTLGRVYDEMT